MRYVALLRGIGPGNPNMRNEKLREVCRSLGYDNIATVVSSGNVIFDAEEGDVPALEAKLESAWSRELGFQSTTIIRSVDEVARLVEDEPFGDRRHQRETYLLVTFVRDPVQPAFPVKRPPTDAVFEITGRAHREVFSVSDNSVTSGLNVMVWLESVLGREITSRTWLTVTRILDKMTG